MKFEQRSPCLQMTRTMCKNVSYKARKRYCRKHTVRVLMGLNVCSPGHVEWCLAASNRRRSSFSEGLENTLKTYFKLAKQCLGYFRQVATCRGYHFSAGAGRDGSRPEGLMDLTAEQLRRWQSVIRLVRLQMMEPDIVSENDVGEAVHVPNYPQHRHPAISLTFAQLLRDVEY